jgi:hypothetical protein
MVARKGDETPTPPGGRAAERLRQFEEARRPHPEQAEDEAVSGGPSKEAPAPDPCASDAKEDPKAKTNPPSISDEEKGR